MTRGTSIWAVLDVGEPLVLVESFGGSTRGKLLTVLSYTHPPVGDSRYEPRQGLVTTKAPADDSAQTIP
jgi:hypothetical protein